jgi:glycosyltransferase involved in cell wall biosynthesis
MDFQEFRKKFEHKEVWKSTNRAGMDPLVSVCVQTYQHVSFIRLCLDSILMQKTNFSFEILLGEDNSRDGTKEICLEYAERFPDKIRLFLHHRENNIEVAGNPTGRFNFLYNLYSSRGKYIALCDGDDYWTDPLKLQKQVDFLESHPEFTLMCGGYKKQLNESGDFEEVIIKEEKHFPHMHDYGFEFGLKDLHKRWLTKTLTTLFRKDAFEMNDLLKYTYLRDVHLFYHIIKNGKGLYFQEIFGVYNLHLGGIHSMKHRAVKIKSGYNIYKELFHFHKDFYTRKSYWECTLGKLKFHLENGNSNKISPSTAKLFIEALKLVRTPKDLARTLMILIKYILLLLSDPIK